MLYLLPVLGLHMSLLLRLILVNAVRLVRLFLILVIFFSSWGSCVDPAYVITFVVDTRDTRVIFSLASVLFSWCCKVIWKCNLLNSIFSIALCCVLNFKFVSFYVTLNSRLWIYVPAEISCWSKGLGSIDILAFITIIDIRVESSLAYNDLFGILIQGWTKPSL